MSCFIVGPGQDPPVHEADEVTVDEGDDAQAELLKMGVDQQTILEAQKAKQGLAIVEAPSLNYIGYQLMVNCYKAENMCMLEDKETPVSPFVSVRSQGCTISTRIAKNAVAPNWG